MLKTVNVVEDDEAGNAAAEAWFRSVLLENADFEDGELDEAVEEGYFEEGTYYAALIHSQVQP